MVVPYVLPLSVLAIFVSSVHGHSVMTHPQGLSPYACRLGGEPRFGVGTCAGPCDLSAVTDGYANYASPDNPARVYRRGQKVTIKYQRNNHGPGGFLRLTLVRPEDMMDKRVHAQNAFHYSCWGANPVFAKPKELSTDKFGYSFIGSDGLQHDFKVGYYVTTLRIPTVVPDGKYIMGWVWFGGGGEDITSNSQQEPKPYGYFSDYWACSYVEIKGGALQSEYIPVKPYGYFSDYWACSYVEIKGGALQSEYIPVFNNDTKAFSSEGCMSADDEPGICSYEPCHVMSIYQKPRVFKNTPPAALTPENFGGENVDVGVDAGSEKAGKRACNCIRAERRCGNKLAARTGGVCSSKTRARDQAQECKDLCCSVCSPADSKPFKLCRNRKVRAICG